MDVAIRDGNPFGDLHFSAEGAFYTSLGRSPRKSPQQGPRAEGPLYESRMSLMRERR